MKKHYYYLFLACCFLKPDYGQCQDSYGLNANMLIPAGKYYPYLLKPGIGGTFSYKAGYIDDKFRYGLLFAYYKFKTKQDTFPTYAISGNKLLPGYEVFNDYSIIEFGPTFDFKILEKKALSPFVGADLAMDVYGISEDYEIETLINSETSGDDYYFNWAFVPRIGVQYQLGDYCLFSMGLSLNMGFGGTYGAQVLWKPFIGFDYCPD